MTLIDIVGLDAKADCGCRSALRTPFSFRDYRLTNPVTNPIDRRTFLALGIGTLAGSQEADSPGLFPVSMDRCVVLSDDQDRQFMARQFSQIYKTPERLDEWADLFRPRETPTWNCKIVLGVTGCLVRDWWLLVAQSESGQFGLTVLHVSSEPREEADLSGLLAARITFRLHVLQRRGALQGGFDKLHIVQRVNQQILMAMKTMPE